MSDNPWFLTSRKLAGGGRVRLDPDESHHAVNVLRLRSGDLVTLFDGAGRYGRGTVAAAGREGLDVDVDEVAEAPRPGRRLTVAAAVPRNKRWQVLVEKCTELGADRIIPLMTNRGVARAGGGIEKWRRWSIEAAKQCGRACLPELTTPLGLEESIALAEREGSSLLVADPRGDGIQAFLDRMPAKQAVLAVIGPEGGLTGDEIDYCLSRGGKFLRLSPFVLRVETAALAVCALLRQHL